MDLADFLGIDRAAAEQGVEDGSRRAAPARSAVGTGGPVECVGFFVLFRKHMLQVISPTARGALLVLAPPRSLRRTLWNFRGTLNPRGTLPPGRPGPPRSLTGLRPQSFQLLGSNICFTSLGQFGIILVLGKSIFEKSLLYYLGSGFLRGRPEGAASKLQMISCMGAVATWMGSSGASNRVLSEVLLLRGPWTCDVHMPQVLDLPFFFWEDQMI